MEEYRVSLYLDKETQRLLAYLQGQAEGLHGRQAGLGFMASINEELDRAVDAIGVLIQEASTRLSEEIEKKENMSCE